MNPFFFLFFFSRVPLSSEPLISLKTKCIHLVPLVLFASAGSSRGGRSAAGSRSLGRRRRRAQTKWWRICSRGPRSTEPWPWNAVGRAPESPADPGYVQTLNHPPVLSSPATVLSFVFLIAVSSWNSALHRRRLQVRGGDGGGVGVCGRREAGRQQPAGREYHQ